MTREERVGRNESAFRELNEAIAEIAVRVRAAEREVADFLCECASITCRELISLSLAVYESIRADPTYFVVLPGHEVADAERVIERRDRYVIIAKGGEAADVAEELDPRS